MRILQVASFYAPAYSFGGPVFVAEGLSHALAKLGHDVTVCCTNRLDERMEGPTGRRELAEGVVYYEPIGAPKYWGYSRELANRVEEQCQKADLVISHFHYQYASIVAGKFARRAKVPHVVLTHGTLNRFGMNARNYWVKRLYLGTIERRNFSTARAVVYHSEEELRTSVQLGRPEILPIALADDELAGVRPDRAAARHAYGCGDRMVFAYVGRIGRGKGLELLMPALAAVAKNIDVQLIVVGSDHQGYEPQVRELVSELGLGERVKFTGFLRGDQKRQALAAADAFVLPSRSEGLSLATLEAMAAGLPVIVTDRMGIWREVSDVKCGLVTPYDVDALTAALTEMARSENRPMMGARGEALVRSKYTWDRVAQQLIEMAR